MKKIDRPPKIEIEQYRKTHSVKATAKHFNIALSTIESILKEYGIYGTDYLQRLNAPDILTKEQEEIIVGNLLGDGWLTRLKGLNANSSFGVEQKLLKSDYVKYLHKIYGAFSKKYSEGYVTNKENGKITYYARTNTIHHQIFTDLRHKWYENPFIKSPKTIPDNIELTWRTIAIWACDDGTNDVERRTFIFCTHGFSQQDVEVLLYKIKNNFNINGKVYNYKNQPRLHFYGTNAEEIKNKIKTFIPWSCFRHKLLPNKPKVYSIK
jgi:transposase